MKSRRNILIIIAIFLFVIFVFFLFFSASDRTLKLNPTAHLNQGEFFQGNNINIVRSEKGRIRLRADIGRIWTEPEKIGVFSFNPYCIIKAENVKINVYVYSDNSSDKAAQSRFSSKIQGDNNNNSLTQAMYQLKDFRKFFNLPEGKTVAGLKIHNFDLNVVEKDMVKSWIKAKNMKIASSKVIIFKDAVWKLNDKIKHARRLRVCLKGERNWVWEGR